MCKIIIGMLCMESDVIMGGGEGWGDGGFGLVLYCVFWGRDGRGL